MPATSAAVAALQSQEGGNSLTYRELNTVLWATCLLVVFIPLVVGLWRLIRYGIEEQASEIKAQMVRDEIPCPDCDQVHIEPDCPETSLTAPKIADSPTQPTQQGQR